MNKKLVLVLRPETSEFGADCNCPHIESPSEVMDLAEFGARTFQLLIGVLLSCKGIDLKARELLEQTSDAIEVYFDADRAVVCPSDDEDCKERALKLSEACSLLRVKLKQLEAIGISLWSINNLLLHYLPQEGVAGSPAFYNPKSGMHDLLSDARWSKFGLLPP